MENIDFENNGFVKETIFPAKIIGFYRFHHETDIPFSVLVLPSRLQRMNSRIYNSRSLLVRHWEFEEKVDTVLISNIVGHVLAIQQPDNPKRFMVVGDQKRDWPLIFASKFG